MEEKRTQMEDPKFYRRSILELANVEMLLQPIYNNALKTRRRSYQLRSLMAEQCIPMLLNFKETLQERTQILNENIQTLKSLNEAMEAALDEINNSLAKEQEER